MNQSDVLKLIWQQVHEAGTQKALAHKWGISLPYLNDVLNERRDPGKAILNQLNLERVISYRRSRDKEQK